MNSEMLRIVLGLVAVFIILTVFNVVFQFFSKDYTTETALLSSGNESESVQGVFIRDEQVITYSGSGVISYEVSDGGKLGIGSVIANIYASESQIQIKQRIALLENELSLLQRISNPGTTQTAQPSNISGLFDETYRSFLFSREKGDLSNLQTQREEMVVLLSTYQLVTQSDISYDARMESIQSEITSLSMAQSAPMDTIVADKSSYFVSYADGYESVLTLSGIDKLTADQLQGITDHPSEDASIVGKMIDGYEWALAAVVDNSAKVYELGDTVTLKFTSTSDIVKGKIVKLDNAAGDAQTLMVVRCEELTYDLVQHRVELVEIIRGEYEGIMVPRSALHFKELTETVTDPETKVVSEVTTNYRGVYVLNGEQPEFRKLDVIYEGKDYVISAQVADNDYLLLYDSIITKGIDADGK